MTQLTQSEFSYFGLGAAVMAIVIFVMLSLVRV
jgi:hypothetical protein